MDRQPLHSSSQVCRSDTQTHTNVHISYTHVCKHTDALTYVHTQLIASDQMDH